MRVLMLASWFPRDDSDPTGRFIIDQAEALKGAADVRVVDCSQHLPLVPQRIRLFARTQSILWMLKQEKWVPDVIHAQVAYPAGVIALRLKKKLGIPVVLTEHTGPLELLLPHFRTEFDFGSHLALYDRVVAVSEHLKKQIQRRAPKVAVDVIGNVVGPKYLSSVLSLEAPQNAAAFIGRLTAEKGVPELLATLEEYDSSLDTPALHLNVLGSGPLEGELRERLKHARKITHTFAPAGGSDEVWSTLSDSSFLILPSQAETFSLVAAEAIAMGRSVVGFRCGGPEDFVNEARGVLLERRDPAVLAEAIGKFAGDPSLMLTEELALRRRKYMSEHYSAQAIREQLLKLYQETRSARAPR